MCQIISDSLQELRHEVAAEIAPFPMNIRIIRSREIDAFKDAPTGFGFGQAIADLQLAVFLHHNSLSGGQFHHLPRRAVEGCLYGRSFTGYHKHLIIEIIIPGADAMCIAYGEDIPRTCHAA